MHVVVNRCNRGNLKHGLPFNSHSCCQFSDKWSLSPGIYFSLPKHTKAFSARFNLYNCCRTIAIRFYFSFTKFAKEISNAARHRLFPWKYIAFARVIERAALKNVVDKTRTTPSYALLVQTSRKWKILRVIGQSGNGYNRLCWPFAIASHIASCQWTSYGKFLK